MRFPICLFANGSKGEGQICAGWMESFRQNRQSAPAQSRRDTGSLVFVSLFRKHYRIRKVGSRNGSFHFTRR